MKNQSTESLDADMQPQAGHQNENADTYMPDRTATTGLAGHLNRLREEILKTPELQLPSQDGSEQ